MNVYALKDELIGFTGAIITAYDDRIIERQVAAMVKDTGSQLNLWPQDFSMWQVGVLDTEDGHITEMQPRLVCRANQFLKKEA